MGETKFNTDAEQFGVDVVLVGFSVVPAPESVEDALELEIMDKRRSLFNSL